LSDVDSPETLDCEDSFRACFASSGVRFFSVGRSGSPAGEEGDEFDPEPESLAVCVESPEAPVVPAVPPLALPLPDAPPDVPLAVPPAVPLAVPLSVPDDESGCLDRCGRSGSSGGAGALAALVWLAVEPEPVEPPLAASASDSPPSWRIKCGRSGSSSAAVRTRLGRVVFATCVTGFGFGGPRKVP
jgi:hypothetical protein